LNPDQALDEFTQLVQQHAVAQRYAFAGGISITMQPDDSLSTGILHVESQNVKGDVAWVPVLDIAGKRYPLTKGRTVVGRGREADITVDDTGTSRKHIEIAWDGSHAQARDLGSTNGSQLNGQPFKKAVLEPESVITIGRTRIVFRVLPQTSARKPRQAEPDDVTRRHDIDGFWQR